MFNQHQSLCCFALLVFFLFVVCSVWCVCAASYGCGAVLRDMSAPPVSVNLLGVHPGTRILVQVLMSMACSLQQQTNEDCTNFF